ncbi:MAG TPA: hypothetical protein VK787_14740 [Puia sp.]|jgi:hypothetical protein|nr:hypothetical protein [Puia sp.]
MNLVEIIQTSLGYPPIKKIDPNTSEPKNKQDNFESGTLAQAALPVTVLGLMNYIDANELNASELDTETHDELDVIFAGKGSEIVSGVATYSGVTEEHTRHEMNFILKEAIRVVKEMNAHNSVPPHQFTVIQKANAILYLPASIHAGLLLGNANMDDSTTKMEGPVSSVLHNIEKKFM